MIQAAMTREGGRGLAYVVSLTMLTCASIVASKRRQGTRRFIIRQVSHYRVLEMLGSGGMGTVWVAEDLNLGRKVALKFLSDDLAGHPQAMERFRMEARTASALNHPNICTIYEIGESEGEAFIAMELIEGETLDRYVQKHVPDLQEVLDLAIQIADALDAAHARGIVHRDIKPSNILVTARGQAKVLDFGLAKLVAATRAADQPTYAGATVAATAEHLTSPGMAVGTTAFMSPEQARGKELDARSDLFSFGAVLYGLTTGRLPFDGATAAVIFDGILNQNPVRPIEISPALPPKMDEIIRTALEKDRDLRYQSAAEMRAELKRLKRATSSGKVPAATTTVIRVPQISKPAGKKGIYFSLAGLLFVAATAMVWYFVGREHSHTFDLQNMKIAQVTTTGNAEVAALSPDRRYVVYALRDGAQESLWVQQLVTGSNVQVLPPDQVHFVAVSFTPDGNYVMFVRSDKSTTNFRGLYQIPVLGGQPTQLIRDIDSAPAFSPDGRQIAFIRGVPGPSKNQVLVANADGTNEHVLAERPTFGAGIPMVAWSADGRNLAMVSNEIRNNVSQWVVELVSVKTGQVRDLHSFSLPARAVAWLPDGHGVLAVAMDPESGRGQIWFVRYPNGELSRFTNDLTDYDICCLEITHDGDSLVAMQHSVVSDVWVARGDGSEPKQITTGEALGLGLSWIGTKLAVSTPKSRWTTMNADGGDRASLFGDRSGVFGLTACGDHLLYTTYRENTFELWRSELDGTNPLILTSVTGAGTPFCAPDSKSLVYQAGSTLWRISMQGGTPVQADVPAGFFGYSPDGKLVVYGRQTLVAQSLESKLIVAPANGGSPLHTFDALYGATQGRFTPDSKGIAFLLTRNHAANIWEQPLAGGDIIQLTRFTGGGMLSFAWSADGRKLAFSRGEQKTDVVMMSHFH